MFQKYQPSVALVVLISLVIGIPGPGLAMPFPKSKLVEHPGGGAVKVLYAALKSDYHSHSEER